MAFAYSDSESKQWAWEGRERKGCTHSLLHTEQPFLPAKDVVVDHKDCCRPLRCKQLLMKEKGGKKAELNHQSYNFRKIRVPVAARIISEQVREQVACARCPFCSSVRGGLLKSQEALERYRFSGNGGWLEDKAEPKGERLFYGGQQRRAEAIC